MSLNAAFLHPADYAGMSAGRRAICELGNA